MSKLSCFFFLMIRRPPRSTLFPLHDALPISSTRPNIVRFEINRPLSGMGHERYVAGRPIDDHRPVDELARRLFERGGIDAIHVNGSVVTVDMAKGGSDDGLIDVIRE